VRVPRLVFARSIHRVQIGSRGRLDRSACFSQDGAVLEDECMIWVLVLLVVLLILALPAWPYPSRYDYGYYPSGILATIVLILLVLWLLGVVSFRV
jgi:Tfp pilus assembly protein PilX